MLPNRGSVLCRAERRGPGALLPSRPLLPPLRVLCSAPVAGLPGGDLPNPPGQGFAVGAAAFEAHIGSTGGVLLLFLLVCVCVCVRVCEEQFSI